MQYKDTVLLYHADCPDGFGAAFSFWKQYGDEISYVPVRHQEPPPDGLKGKEIFIADFAYPKDVLMKIEKEAKRLVILDHHLGMREATESVKEHVFDNDRSGTGIAWGYVHPKVPLPRMLAYVQENDLWRFTLPHSKEVTAYLSTLPYDFARWDTVMNEMEDEIQFQEIVRKGAAFREYSARVLADLASRAEEVEFEERRVLAVNAPRFFRSELGHILAEKKAPYAIVWYEERDVRNFSLRGDGSVDVAELCARYGGGGHHDAAGFRTPLAASLPFTRI